MKGFSLIVGISYGIDYEATVMIDSEGIIITGIAQYLVDGKPLGPKDGYVKYD